MITRFATGLALLCSASGLLAQDRLSAEEARWKQGGSDMDARWVMTDYLGESYLIDMASVRRSNQRVSFWTWEEADSVDKKYDEGAVERKTLQTIDCSSLEMSRDSEVIIGSNSGVLRTYDRPVGSSMRRTVPGSTGERIAMFGCG